jgi:hypothetical protein
MQTGSSERRKLPAQARLQLRAVIQERRSLNFEPASYACNVVDRDIALRSLDSAEVGAIDTALVGQRLLAQATFRPKAAHIPRQNVPQRPFVSLFHKPLANARALPRRVEDPFRVRSGQIGGQLALTIDNAKRDGVRVAERADGSQRAGSIEWAAAGQHMEFAVSKKPLPKSAQVPVWYELQINSILSAEARYGTLVHELAHLYCGHLGTPNARWWPDRQNQSLTVREFEAESVSYLVCTRLGIDTSSDEYLAGYVRRCPATPPISLDRVMKSVWLLEQMGRAHLGLRKR